MMTPATSRPLPDSFAMRVKIKGQGLKDFVLNYPYLFEVAEPDDIALNENEPVTGRDEDGFVSPQPPEDHAPAVCVIDSGIQEGHLLLAPAIDESASHCFLNDEEATNVADFVSPGGHGTRVAGAVLYGEQIPRNGPYHPPCWIQNARVLDATGHMPAELFPPALLRAIVLRYHEGSRGTRVFNHSVNADCHCRLGHMSAWAAEIDSLCDQFDILIVQSAGNLPDTATAPRAGIIDHLKAGRTYPDYFTERSSRIANPAQSLQALTVGSVAYEAYRSAGWESFAKQPAPTFQFQSLGIGGFGTSSNPKSWNSVVIISDLQVRR